MTKKQCIIACAIINLLCISAQIYKHTQFIQYTYRKQTQEHVLNECEQNLSVLNQRLYASKDRTAIRQFAQKELGMEPIKLTQIKRL
jgi:hypothetical protein